MLDADCWKRYPQQKLLFNKLWIADMLGYYCGPCGVPVDLDGKYIVRPIYNLDGMSRGASTKELKQGDISTQPGYFWCEFFHGVHYSVDFTYQNGKFEQTLVAKAEKDNEYKFTSWTRVPSSKYKFVVPNFVEFFAQNQVQYLNIEYIDDKVIEVHLRRNPDFLHHNYSRLVVVWASSWDSDRYKNARGQFIPSQEPVYNEKGEIIDTRLGFYGSGVSATKLQANNEVQKI